MSLPLRLWDNLMLISNLRSKQDPCSLSCYVHVTMHKSTSFFLCRASLKEGFWGETLSMCGHCLAFELSLLLMNGFYKIVVWTTMICIDIFICLWENLLDLSTDENATKFWLDYEQMTSNCCNMGTTIHEIHILHVAKTFRIRKNFPVSIAGALTGFFWLWPLLAINIHLKYHQTHAMMMVMVMPKMLNTGQSWYLS